MRNILLAIFCCFFVFVSKAQNDTIYTSARGMADTIYSNFSIANCTTGKLLNRIVNRKDSSLSWLNHVQPNLFDTIIADHIYNLVNEYNFMSFDTVGVLDPRSYYKHVTNHFLTANEESVIVPLGLVDFNFNFFNEDSLINSGDLSVNGPILEINGGSIPINKSRISFVGPAFDFVEGEIFEFILLDELIITEDSSGIKNFEINFGSGWSKHNVNETIEAYAPVSDLFYFDIRVNFNSGYTIENTCALRTPENENFLAKSTSFSCDESGIEVDGDGKKLKWCLLHGCVPNGSNSTWDKPYIMVSGYRPPWNELSWKKFYKLYNEWHNDYIDQLRRYGYDVFLVKFNYHYKPFSMGTDDASELFIQFLNMLNARKDQDADAYYENIIQGNSMGADVVRLALIKMENAHFNQNKPHHHSRLFISHDANYYGANIPLSQQYLAKSKLSHTPLTGFLPYIIYLYINDVMEATLFRELVLYHCNPAINNYPDFNNNNIDESLIPSAHIEKLALDNILNNTYQGSHIVPVPDHCRNISIALGKISQTNDIQVPNVPWNNYPDRYSQDGAVFANWNGLSEQYYVRASTTGNYYQDLFKRRSIMSWQAAFFTLLRQKVKVKDMLAIDNSSGSFLRGFANFGAVLGGLAIIEGAVSPIDVSEFALGYQLERTRFTHKPVSSALAINQNLWPSNGSMTLDMQGLGIMYQSEYNLSINLKSNHFGYPHLGNPSNHFDITPFEAIYVDNEVHPHIEYEDSYDPNVDSLNSFLLNEVEPWYLGLQNLTVGSQVLPSVTYKSERRAKFLIEVGEDVTPITNQNPYVAEPNADIRLHAGNEVIFKPGVHIKNGAQLHAYIEYTDCSQNLVMSNYDEGIPLNYNTGINNTNNDLDDVVENQENSKIASTWDVKIFPNPTNNDYFYLEVLSESSANNVKIYSSLGKLLYDKHGIFGRSTKILHNLTSGVYFILVTKGFESITKKVIIK